MNRYCSRLYRKVCLEINSGLTTKEKEELLFYCRDVLPDAVTENSSILTTLTELQRRRILLFEDTSFLRQFLEDIERLDLLSKVEAFDVSRELVWLFESVMSSKIRRKFCHGPFDVGNGDDGNRLLSDFVKHQDVSDRIGRLTVAARRQLKEKEQEGSGIANITSILVDFRWEIIEHSDSKQMTWQLIPPLIKFASELAISNYTNGCTVDVGEKIVVSICNQLVKDVLPWIIKNGGWVCVFYLYDDISRCAPGRICKYLFVFLFEYDYEYDRVVLLFLSFHLKNVSVESLERHFL